MQPDIVGEQRPQAVPVLGVEQRDVTRDRFRYRLRCGQRRGLRVDLAKACAPASEVGLDGIDRQVEQIGNVLQRFIKHVLEDDDTALHERKLRKTRYRRLDRFLTHQDLHRVRAGFVGDIGSGFDRIGLAHGPAAQDIERAVMRDPKQPRPKLRHVSDLVERRQRPGHRVLHDVLTVDHRTHQPRAVTMQLGAEFGRQGHQLRPRIAIP